MAQYGQVENLYDVRVTINGTDGKQFKFTADTFDGGNATAKGIKYRAGNGINDEIGLQSATTYSNVSVKALMTLDIEQHLYWLLKQTGKAQMVVHKQPLDTDGNAFGKALVYVGLLDDTTPTKTDSESDTAATVMFTQNTVTVAQG